MNELKLLKHFLRVLWIALGLGLVCWIVLQNVPPSGRLTVTTLPAQASAFVGVLRPDDRAAIVTDGQAAFYELTDEPAYFSLNVPRFFRHVSLKLEYQNADQPIVELGARTDLAQWRFDLQPIEALLLDRAGWSVREDSGYRIYEKRPTERSAADILHGGDPRKTAVYHLDPVRWGMRLPGAADRGAVLDHPLKGNQHLYVYAANPSFQASLDVSGPVMARLIKDGQTLLTRSATEGTIDLSISDAPTGLYRIDVEADDSVIVRGVRTRDAVLVAAGEPFPPGFMPEFPVINSDTRLDDTAIDTVVAEYRPPETLSDGWKSAQAEFDVGRMARRGVQAQMIVSVPGLKARGGSVRIRKIDVAYEREPLSLKSLLDYLMKKL